MMLNRWSRVARIWKWWLIALMVRGTLFWVFLEEHGFHHSLYGWGPDSGDTGSYLEPIDSLLAGKGYVPDMRMPGYGAVYLLFRLVSTEPGAGVLLILAQLLFGALSCAVLARLAEMLGAGVRWQHFVFWGYVLCPRSALTDIHLLTESFCTSAIILAAFHWVAHLRKPSVVSPLLSGAWLAWAVFLRPVYAILLPLFLLGLFWPWRSALRNSWRYAVVFALPFLLADGVWTVRNWREHRHLRPLANSVYYPEMGRSPISGIFRYLQAYGGNQACWDPRADIRWFNMREGPEGRAGRLRDIDVEPPAIAFSERCTRDSLLLLAADMAKWIDTASSDEDRPTITRRANARSERYVRYFREDRPFVHYIWSRCRTLGLQLGQSGMDGLFEQHFRGDPPFAPLLTAWNDAWYWIVMPSGLAFAIVTLIRGRCSGRARYVLAAILIAGILVYPFVFRMCEGRYIFPMYPWLLLFTVLGIEDLLSRRGLAIGGDLDVKPSSGILER